MRNNIGARLFVSLNKLNGSFPTARCFAEKAGLFRSLRWTYRIACLMGLLSMMLPGFAEPEPLLSEDSTPVLAGEGRSMAGPFKRVRTAALQKGAFKGVAPDWKAGHRVRLNFFKDACFDAVLLDVTHEAEGGAWRATGRVESVDGSLVLLSGHKTALVGSASMPGLGRFRLEGGSSGDLTVIELSDAVPRCATCESGSLVSESSTKHSRFTKQRLAPVLDPLTNSVVIVDLMVVHTAAAREGAGGDSEIRALAALAVAEANAVYQNSRANVRLRLAHQQEVAYAESPSFSTNLARLRIADDGFLDEVHALRQTHKADLVCLLTEGGDIGFGGLASLMQEAKPESRNFGFSVVRRRDAVGNYVFVHEITHNFGCQHDRENAAGSNGQLIPGVFNYSFGRRFMVENVLYRTVMAYPPGEAVPFLSTPSILFRGVPLGISESETNSAADNVRTVNLTAPIVGAYLGELTQTLVPTVSWSAPAEGAVVTSGHPVTVTVAAGDLDGFVRRVEFYDGNILAGIVSEPPAGNVSFTLANMAPGAHALSVRVVDDKGADSGLVERTIVARPGNDDFANRITLTGETFSTRGSTGGATREMGEPIHAGNLGAGSVWFTWLCPKSGFITLTSVGDRFTEILDVYVGSSLGSLGTTFRTVRFKSQERTCVASLDVVAGQILQIAVDSLPGTGEGFTLTLAYQRPPDNDAFMSRKAVSGAALKISGSTEFSTSEPGEPLHAGFAGGRSVWFEWDAPKSGSVTVICSGPNVTWLVDAYQGESVGALTPAPAHFVSIDQIHFVTTLVFNAVEHGKYAIAVDGSLGLSGPFTLELAYPPPPANDMFANRRVIQGTNVVFTDNSFAATSEPGEPDHAATSSAKSLWYSWTAPVSGPVKISMKGTGFSVLPDAYQGTALGNLKVVNRGIKVIPGTTSELTFQAVLGQVYEIVADGFGAKGGLFSFSLVTSNQPAQLLGKASLSPATMEFRFQIGGSPGQRYSVESSPDLERWTFQKTGTIGGEPEVFQDVVPLAKGSRFYRVFPLP